MCSSVETVAISTNFMLSKKRVNKFLGFFTFKFFLFFFSKFFKVHHMDYIRRVNYKLNVGGA